MSGVENGGAQYKGMGRWPTIKRSGHVCLIHNGEPTYPILWRREQWLM